MSQNSSEQARTVGVSISRSGSRAVLVEGAAAIANRADLETSNEFASLESIASVVREAAAKFNDVSAIGIAVPGLIESATHRVSLSKWFPQTPDLDLAGELKKMTGLDIYVVNDANAASVAESRLGAGRSVSDMFYVLLGDGVGGAIINKGELLTGSRGFAGEFGSFAVDPEGKRIEDIASADGLVLRLKERMHQDPTSSLSSITDRKITVADVLQAAENEDDLALLVLRRTGEFLGIAVAGVVNLLNPHMVVIGGELAKAGEPLLSAIKESAQQLTFVPSFANVEIVTGELGDDAAAIGAAVLAAEK